MLSGKETFSTCLDGQQLCLQAHNDGNNAKRRHAAPSTPDWGDCTGRDLTWLGVEWEEAFLHSAGSRALELTTGCWDRCAVL